METFEIINQTYGRRRGQIQNKIKIENIYRIWKGNGLVYMICKKLSDFFQITTIAILLSVLCFYNFNIFNKSDNFFSTTWWRWAIFSLILILFIVMINKYSYTIFKTISKYYSTSKYCNQNEIKDIFNNNDWDDKIIENGISGQLNTEEAKRIRNQLDIFNGGNEITNEEIHQRILRKLSFTDDVISCILRRVIENYHCDHFTTKLIQKTCQTKYFIKYLINVLNKTTKEVFLTTPIQTDTPDKFSFEHYLYLKQYDEMKYIFIETFKNKLILSIDTKILFTFVGSIFTITSSVINFIFLKDFSLFLNNTWSYGAIKLFHNVEFQHTQQYHLNKASSCAKSLVERKISTKYKKMVVRNIKITLVVGLILMLVFSLNGNDVANIEIDESSALAFLNPFKGFVTTGIIVFLIYFLSQYANESETKSSSNEVKTKIEDILKYHFPEQGSNSIKEIDKFYYPEISKMYFNELIAPFRTANLMRKSEARDEFGNGLNDIWINDRFTNQNSPYDLAVHQIN